METVKPADDNSAGSVVVIVFDTMSACNLSLYGYPRKTSPNLERFAERANIYHSHYSAGNFTTPGTASLLTGLYPWTHRAINTSGLVNKAVIENNIFHYLANSHFNLAFSQNNWVDLLLYQFGQDIDQHVNSAGFEIIDRLFTRGIFPNDSLMAYKSLDEFMEGIQSNEIHGSLFLYELEKFRLRPLIDRYTKRYRNIYPRGIPPEIDTKLTLLMDDYSGFDLASIGELTSPGFFYLHYLPPHEPYAPHRDFIGMFKHDGFEPLEKPKNEFSGDVSIVELNKHRTDYDEFIAHTDAEFGKLYDKLMQTPWFDQCTVIITSDHGQLFERGVHGHITPFLYEPLIRIPLLISTPNQRQRVDIHELTSSVDLVPTIAHLNGISTSAEIEGQILPGLGGEKTAQRPVYAVESKTSRADRPISSGTFAIMHDRNKLIRYRGYPGVGDRSELFDLANDPEEMEDLIRIKMRLAKDLGNLLDEKLEAAAGGER